MRKRTLAFITASYPYGRAETFIETELPYLLEVFDEITIFPFSVPSELPREVPPGVNISLELSKKFWKATSLPSLIFVTSLLSQRGLAEFVRGFRKSGFLVTTKSILSVALAVGKCHSVLGKWASTSKAERYFYSYWLGSGTLAASNLPSKIKKVISRAHRVDLYEEESPSTFIAFYDAALFACDQVFCISRHGLNYLNTRLPAIQDRVVLSPLGVRGEGFRPLPPETNMLRIISCSSLEPQKQPCFLAQCVAVAATKHPHVRFIWTHFGDGSLRSNFLSTSKALPSNTDFDWRGMTSNREVRHFMAETSADVFLNVSLSEGLPVSIMEAMAESIPVAATDVGGTSEIVNSSTGHLLSPHPSIKEVADALASIIANPAEWEAKRAEAFNTWLTRFNADVNLPKFVQIVTSE